MTSMSSLRVLRVSSRAFVSKSSKGRASAGGNPVDIFAPLALGGNARTALTVEERVKLSRSCDWESIVIENIGCGDHSSEGNMPSFHFHMPSGEEVSFCAHAAIGGCSLLALLRHAEGQAADWRARSELLSGLIVADSKPIGASKCQFTAAMDPSLIYDATIRDGCVKMDMDVTHEEEKCNPESLLGAFLSEIGLRLVDVSKCGGSLEWPTFVNSSVARHKTLIPIKSTGRLHAATAPNDPEKFREMCDSIGSTGVYLYSTESDPGEVPVHFECRQFPRASGYAEDPATGIAAGCLAVSLDKRGIARGNNSGTSRWRISQGVAMGMPSTIGVEVRRTGGQGLTIGYDASVAFDSVEVQEI
ncbi:hypothetical protein THAOC_18394 [Thalassiosira oceanica]|uniref:Uncharacterized protein n=1 Tax=Thalassiosira oceanica TaxID=159749 RepID=K0S8E6_THAOC|nr:hypothetical protein THAOC_18394 [Thalassiosira oceanica]|eukprot:EJK61164.1 hypothetical protein THAOC_18394 [Thalassiosira oceanica]